ncbi:hypothetical protein N798_17200 [Knoellia flava TL1]|uniref:Uncharacterized protein n=2 Tax=Knoellia flava TaxID=913969 RepID=A0A8H9FWG0_9MICO|nr:hypothetical protein [Knoellia flava]KGN28842.1 hypothetical protein N798_17200 [Knoellia flava TL1]GGB85491.1 hypothetical protein GCM10011314_26500 [Knoellia flava]
MGTDTELVLLLWAARAFAILALLGVLAVLGSVWWTLVLPVLTEARRARTAGDWWLPFTERPDGGWGPLAANRWWSGMRASTRGSTGGLAVRWGFWSLAAVGLTLGIGQSVWQLGRLAALALS